MEFSELIRNRESIRNYDPQRPVEQSILDKILTAGRLAPTAANRQPLRFVVVQSEDMLKKVKTAYGGQFFQDAPQVLIVVGLKDKAWVRKSDNYCSVETDCTIAMDHMILAAENEGVATCWIAAFDPEKLRSALSLNEKENVFAITPLGYPKTGFVKNGEKERKDIADLTQYL